MSWGPQTGSGVASQLKTDDDSVTYGSAVQISKEELVMMSEAYELQVDNNGVPTTSVKSSQKTVTISPSQAKKEVTLSDGVNESIKNTVSKNNASPSKGYIKLIYNEIFQLLLNSNNVFHFFVVTNKCNYLKTITGMILWCA